MILDTNAVSAMAAMEQSILEVVAATPTLRLPFVVYAEFRYGLLGSNRPEAGTKLLVELAARFPLLFPEPETLEQYALIKDRLKRSGRKIPENDLWIAALARQHTMPILSRDKHFDFIPDIQRIDW